nr:immunoglobulin light chain junction region [Macaca mulatta]
CYQYHSGYTF